MKTILITVLLFVSATTFSQQQWEVVNFPTQDNLIEISFISPTNGWILSTRNNNDDYLVHRTFDGGATWEKIYDKKHSSYNVWEFEMLDDSVGYMIGQIVEDMFFTKDTYKTVDGGVNWTRLNYDYKNIKGKSSNYYSFADDSLRTVIGGETKSFDFAADLVENNGTANVWAVKLYGQDEIGLSTDSGSTWKVQQLPFSDGVREIDFVDDKNGAIITVNVGDVNVSKDAGASWQAIKKVPYAVGEISNSISLAKDATIFVSGNSSTSGNHIYSFDESGDVWHTDLTTNLEISEMIFDGDHTWAIAKGGGLWKTKDVITTFNDVKTLATNVYPNPFTNEITIAIGQHAVEVRVTNVQGIVIYNEVVHQSTTVNTSEWKAGVYFVELRTQSGVSAHTIVK